MVCALAVYCVVVFSKFKVLCCERSCCFLCCPYLPLPLLLNLRCGSVSFFLSLIWQWRIRRGVWRWAMVTSNNMQHDIKTIQHFYFQLLLYTYIHTNRAHNKRVQQKNCLNFQTCLTGVSLLYLPTVPYRTVESNDNKSNDDYVPSDHIKECIYL